MGRVIRAVITLQLVYIKSFGEQDLLNHHFKSRRGVGLSVENNHFWRRHHVSPVFFFFFLVLETGKSKKHVFFAHFRTHVSFYDVNITDQSPKFNIYVEFD